MTRKELAIRLANREMETYTLEDLKNFVFDRLVDEIYEDARMSDEVLERAVNSYGEDLSGDNN